MAMKRPIFVRALSDAERETLEAGMRSSDAFVLRRCRILLASSRGDNAYRIAKSLGCTPQTARNAIHTFNERGLPEALQRGSKRPHEIHRAFDPGRAEDRNGNAETQERAIEQLRERLSKKDRQLKQARELVAEKLRQLSEKHRKLAKAREQLSEKMQRSSEKDRRVSAHQGSPEASIAAAVRYAAEEYGYEHGLPVVDLLDLLPGFAETVTPYSFLEGQALPTDMALLKGLARRTPGCRYFEIGSWRGESLANVASVAEECVSLNLSGEELRELGFAEDFVRQHKFYSGGLENVRHIEHNSRTFDFSAFENRFDLVFVDGDHSREGVRIDTRNVFGLLRDDRSVIVWHDYGFTPEKVNWPVFAGILDGCPEDKRGELYRVSNTLCAVYLNKREELHAGGYETSSRTFSGFQTPNKTFEVKLTARREPSST